jgi:hypothetical protein
MWFVLDSRGLIFTFNIVHRGVLIFDRYVQSSFIALISCGSAKVMPRLRPRVGSQRSRRTSRASVEAFDRLHNLRFKAHETRLCLRWPHEHGQSLRHNVRSVTEGFTKTSPNALDF